MNTPVEQPAPKSRRKPLYAVGALGVAAVIGAAAAFGGTTLVAGTATAADGVMAARTLPSPYGSGSSGGSGGQSYGGNETSPYGGQGYGGYGGYGTSPYGGLGGTGSGETGTGSSGTTTAATSDQEVGVVDIDTVLSYAGAEAAGTGLVLSSDGLILTNNHVIEGSTSITVTIVSSGQTYRATVVGSDTKDDIAVLQLTDASGLATANFGTSANLQVGDAVTGVGNAGGGGGTPAAAAGQVSDLNQTITTEAEGVSEGETLTGLIETTADIESGDSGGPLFNSDDQVVGIDTAAETTSSGQSVTGYAIPIDTALSIAKQITGGQESDNIVLGYPAFLGVQVSTTGTSTGVGSGSGRGRYGTGSSATTVSGATIAGVVDGSPAAQAGLAAGDTITGIDSTTISTADGLSDALGAYKPGDTVTVTWMDSSGAQQSASVTLIEGPAA